MRTVINLNYDWEFSFNFSEAFAAGSAEATQLVHLPHTCTTTPYDYFDEGCYQTVCGYRRKVNLPEHDSDSRIFLIIEGAAHSAQVYVDGRPVGEKHTCGYTSFETELTENLSGNGEHILCISVDSREQQNIPPFGNVVDYMTYGGLYREVRLEIRSKSFISDIFAKPCIPPEIRLTPDSASEQAHGLRFEGELRADITVSGKYDSVRIIVREKGSGDEIIRQEFAPGEEIAVRVPDAHLWDVESPFLYELEAQLISGGSVCDSVGCTFGFRSARFCREGFFLNGRRLQITGLDRHQSYAHVGYAMPKSMQRLDAEILRNELGLNAVRTSHYPQSRHFIDRCDELGLLVFTEIPGWQYIGDKDWQDAAVRNTEEMVMQYRNHPSIILWGVRINESQDNDELYRRTNEVAHRLDPTRQTSGVRFLKKSSLLEDVYAYNDFTHSGKNKGSESKRRVSPDMSKPYFISEYCGHMFPTKNYDCESHRLELAMRHARILDSIAAHKDIAGSFGWCFADYNTHKEFGSGDRICYHGVCDMYRNPKLAAAVYAIRQKERPVLVVSTMGDIGDHPEGIRGRAYIFTNCDKVQLYRSGKLICEYFPYKSEFRNLKPAPVRLTDIIGSSLESEGKYSKSQIRNIAYVLNETACTGTAGMGIRAYIKSAFLILSGVSYSELYSLYSKYVGGWGDNAVSLELRGFKNGECVITKVVEAFEKACLSAELSSSTLVCSDTYDVASVRLQMTDQNGNVLPYYFGTVQAEIEGPIELYGTKNAVLRGGTGGLYVRTTGKTGHAVLTLTDEYGNSLRLDIDVKKDTNA